MDFSMGVAGILRLHLMLLSLTASHRRERHRDVRNSRRGKVGILEAIKGMTDIRSQCAPRLEMGKEIDLKLDREADRDTGMGRRVRSRGRSTRCGLRRRLGICRSGWRSTSTCRWISRSVSFARSRVLTG